MNWAVLALALSACYAITTYPGQPRMTAPASDTYTQVRVHWQPDLDAIAKACPEEPNKTIYACARWGGGICDVQAIKPDDFNDVPKLAVLGHELLHCLGAKH